MEMYGVDQAVQALMLNDPYYPSPMLARDDGEENLPWVAFSVAYLMMSKRLRKQEENDKGREVE